MTRRPRHLSPEERELWARVAHTVQALHPFVPPALAPEARKAAPPPKPNARLPDFGIGDSARLPAARHDLLPPLDERLAHQPVRMDRKAHQQLQRGKLVPEGRIDLHGMTLTEAHPELLRFVLRAHQQGKRLVLVITGKGKQRDDHGPIPARQGVLRHQVPQWLTQPPLGGIVMQIAPAHARHGGLGAYYVYLRRLR